MKKLELKLGRNTGIKINKEIYGHFSEHLGRCIYGGIYVGKDSDIPNVNGCRKDVLEALKEISVPVLRWPGGCFADEYHWKDGIGDLSRRAKMINTNWGHITEDNSFGTHEFLDMCEELGCEPYIAGNLGSGTVRELAEWVEYMTFDGKSPMADLRKENGREKPWRVKYLGIGNESWGCGGNMRPEFYSDLYKQYQSFCKNFSGNELYKVACGPNADDYNWTGVLMDNLNQWHAKAISLHYYTVPSGNWDKKGSATEFDTEEYYETLRKTLHMKELIEKHSEIMDKKDPDNNIGLIVDEWGTWYDVEPGTNPGFLYQQNTMRDAMVAALNLNIFNSHSKKVVMANIAQTVNVLQALLLTEGDKTIKTPTFYVFKLMKEHQEGSFVESGFENTENCADGLSMVSQSVSEKDGVLTITLANVSADEEAEITLADERLAGAEVIYGGMLAGEMHKHNTFDDPDAVKDEKFAGYTLEGDRLKLLLPPVSVVSIRIKKGKEKTDI